MHILAKKLLVCLLPASLALAATTQVSTDMPIVNFRLPAFTPDGYRAWMARGSEARYAPGNRIDIKELTLSIFSGRADEKIDTIILSPEATVLPAESYVSGPTSIRVINDQLEASGTGWSYAQKDKKVSITKHVRVTFRAEFKDFLK